LPLRYLYRFNNILDRKNPAKTATSVNEKERIIFINAILYSPSRIRLKVSRLKDEKVVYPPKTPINKKSLRLGGNIKRSKNTHRNPIAKEPDTFATRVPIGKTPFEKR